MKEQKRKKDNYLLCQNTNVRCAGFAHCENNDGERPILARMTHNSS